jgi:flavin reductase (DIM6/NTAB) family NADH-FMN oxidoreductase RutF
MTEYPMKDLDVRERYLLLNRLVAPRPIALVSSLNSNGLGNLAPFSFFSLGGANPPSAVFCPLNDRHGEAKDSLLNIRETKEYVISIVTREMAEKVNQASWTYARGVDEFDQAGLTRATSRVVAPPRVKESPVAMECHLFQIVDHGEGALASSYIIGEIVHVHVDDAVLTGGMPDPLKLDQVGRCGADWYTHVSAGSMFELGRPEGP